MNTRLVKRDLFDAVAHHLGEREITVIAGARQTGKTTLLSQLKEWLIADRQVTPPQILSFNLDLINDFASLQDQGDFVRFLREEISGKKFIYVFIDEIQRLEDPGRFLKGVYDAELAVKIIVSGSSSLEMRRKVSESLAGRKRIFHLWPFSFGEYLSHFAPDLAGLLGADGVSSINQKKIAGHFGDFLIFGGYPRLIFSPNNDDRIALLNELYSSYIEKDIVGFMKVKNPLVFSRMVTLLGDQVGALANLHEISSTLGINFRTAESYLSALEETFVIHLARPFFTNARTELTKMPKVFFADTGLRNLAVKYFAPFAENRDKGKLLENFVASVLARRGGGVVNYWRTKDRSEVDFVFKDYYGHSVPIEVKAGALRAPEITRGMRSFIDRYKPERALVVNPALKEQITIAATRVEFIPPYMLEYWGQTPKSR